MDTPSGRSKTGDWKEGDWGTYRYPPGASGVDSEGVASAATSLAASTCPRTALARRYEARACWVRGEEFELAGQRGADGVEAVLTASEDDLREADGVGPITAERIREVVGSEYAAGG